MSFNMDWRVDGEVENRTWSSANKTRNNFNSSVEKMPSSSVFILVMISFTKIMNRKMSLDLLVLLLNLKLSY